MQLKNCGEFCFINTLKFSNKTWHFGEISSLNSIHLNIFARRFWNLLHFARLKRWYYCKCTADHPWRGGITSNRDFQTCWQNFGLWSYFFIYLIYPVHFNANFKIFNVDMFGIFFNNHLVKLRSKIIGGLQWVPALTATKDLQYWMKHILRFACN